MSNQKVESERDGFYSFLARDLNCCDSLATGKIIAVFLGMSKSSVMEDEEEKWTIPNMELAVHLHERVSCFAYWCSLNRLGDVGDSSQLSSKSKHLGRAVGEIVVFVSAG